MLESTRQRKRSVNQNTGRRLAEIRIHRKWSQQQLADALNVGVSSVKHWERGRNHITADWLLRFSEVLNVRAADLLAKVGSKIMEINDYDKLHLD